jgi:hypothetical protein
MTECRAKHLRVGGAMLWLQDTNYGVKVSFRRKCNSCFISFLDIACQFC